MVQRIPWVTYEEQLEQRLAQIELLGSTCCFTAMLRGTGGHLEDPACPRNHAALVLQALLFPRVYGMRAPSVLLLREASWPPGLGGMTHDG